MSLRLQAVLIAIAFLAGLTILITIIFGLIYLTADRPGWLTIPVGILILFLALTFTFYKLIASGESPPWWKTP